MAWKPVPVVVSTAAGDSTVTTMVRSAGARSGSDARSASIANSEPSVQSKVMRSMAPVSQHEKRRNRRAFVAAVRIRSEWNAVEPTKRITGAMVVA